MNYANNVQMQAPQAVPNTQGAFNNALASAQAQADPRFHVKNYDRSGVSRGKGQAHLASVQGANALAQGIADAYAIPAQDATTNAQNTLNYQQAAEQFGLGSSAIGMQNDYANALASLQRQQQAMNFQGQALNGLLGGAGSFNLDSFLGF